MSRLFLTELDRTWPHATEPRIRLKIIGSTALMLQANYMRGTKDSDVLETEELTVEVKQELLRLAGRKSELYRKHKLYIEFVGGGLPFLPPSPVWCDPPGLGNLEHFQILTLDIVDVVVSKFARFSANDVSDIEAMVSRDLVPHDKLIDRFRSAMIGFEMDARADRLPRFIERLHEVESDIFGIEPTNIEIPAGFPRNDPKPGSSLATPAIF
jgi:hypothetical protein